MYVCVKETVGSSPLPSLLFKKGFFFNKNAYGLDKHPPTHPHTHGLPFFFFFFSFSFSSLSSSSSGGQMEPFSEIEQDSGNWQQQKRETERNPLFFFLLIHNAFRATADRSTFLSLCTLIVFSPFLIFSSLSLSLSLYDLSTPSSSVFLFPFLSSLPLSPRPPRPSPLRGSLCICFGSCLLHFFFFEQMKTKRTVKGKEKEETVLKDRMREPAFFSFSFIRGYLPLSLFFLHFASFVGPFPPSPSPLSYETSA